ncbi:MAG: outer membrane beta-barrel protein [Geminicoccaceae bacterium]
MRTGLVLAIVATGLTMKVASAQPATNDGPYIGLAIAQSTFYDVDAGDGTEIDFNSGSAVRGQVGYGFGSWRAQAEVAYQFVEFEDADDDEFDTDIIRGTLSLLYDFAPISMLDSPSPYVGGGIGIANIAVDGEDEDDETGVTFHGELGLTYDVTDSFALMPQYRFEWFETNEVADIQDNLFSHAFGVAGRYHF